jgi:hypothetical protein
MVSRALCAISSWFCVAFGDVYLWVADPRQVALLMSGQKKATKEKADPDGANTPLRFLPESALA